MRRGQKGFTLIELMIVVAIIGILAAIAIPNFISFKKKAIISAAISNLETARSALTQYAADNDTGCYPAAIADFATMRTTLSGYGLTFPATEAGIKWVSMTYTGEACAPGPPPTGIRFTIQVLAGDNQTRLRAVTMGICCDDLTTSQQYCADYAKNSPQCGALGFGL